MDIRQKYVSRLNAKLSSSVAALASIIKKAEEESINDAWIKSRLPDVMLKDIIEFARNNSLPEVLIRNYIAARYKIAGDDSRLPFEVIRDIINYLRGAGRYDLLTRFADFMNERQPSNLPFTVGELTNRLESSLGQLRQAMGDSEYKQLEAAIRPYINHLRSLPQDKQAPASYALFAQLLARPYVNDKMQVKEDPEASLVPGATQKGKQDVDAIREQQKKEKPADKQQASTEQKLPVGVESRRIPLRDAVADKPPGVYDVTQPDGSKLRVAKFPDGRVVAAKKTVEDTMREHAKQHREATKFYEEAMKEQYEDKSEVKDTRYGKITDDALKLAEQWSLVYNKRAIGYDTFWDKGDIIGIARRYFTKTDDKGNKYIDVTSVKSAVALVNLLQTLNSLDQPHAQGPKGRATIERRISDLMQGFSPEEWNKIEQTYLQLTEGGTRRLNDYDIMIHGRGVAYPEASGRVSKLFPQGRFGEEEDWRRKAWEERQKQPTPLPFPDKRHGYGQDNRVPLDPRIEEAKRIRAFLRGEIPDLNAPLPGQAGTAPTTHDARQPSPPPSAASESASQPFDEDAYYRGLSNRIYQEHGWRLPTKLLSEATYGLLTGRISEQELREYLFRRLVHGYGMDPRNAHSYINALLNANPRNLPGLTNEHSRLLYGALAEFMTQKQIQSAQGQPGQTPKQQPVAEQPTAPRTEAEGPTYPGQQETGRPKPDTNVPKQPRSRQLFDFELHTEQPAQAGEKEQRTEPASPENIKLVLAGINSALNNGSLSYNDITNSLVQQGMPRNIAERITYGFFRNNDESVLPKPEDPNFRPFWLAATSLLVDAARKVPPKDGRFSYPQMIAHRLLTEDLSKEYEARRRAIAAPPHVASLLLSIENHLRQGRINYGDIMAEFARSGLDPLDAADLANEVAHGVGGNYELFKQFSYPHLQKIVQALRKIDDIGYKKAIGTWRSLNPPPKDTLPPPPETINPPPGGQAMHVGQLPQSQIAYTGQQERQPISTPPKPSISMPQVGLPSSIQQGLPSVAMQEPQQPRKPNLVRQLESDNLGITSFAPNIV